MMKEEKTGGIRWMETDQDEELDRQTEELDRQTEEPEELDRRRQVGHTCLGFKPMAMTRAKTRARARARTRATRVAMASARTTARSGGMATA